MPGAPPAVPEDPHAAGTGALGFHIAERLGAQGRVISADFASEMVDVARRNGDGGALIATS
jgi:ubiquinone/menaquinone biosynthesis C-methylase UbiE